MLAVSRALRGLLLATALTVGGCGGGGGGGTGVSPVAPPVIAASNQLLLTIAQNPDISSYITANMPYVTVTVCNATGNCAVVPHVLLDTGSEGLRLLASTVSGLNLAPVTAAGLPVGECAGFVSSVLWGAVRMASVQLGGETTSAQIPIQVFSDPTFTAASTPIAGTTTQVCQSPSPTSSASPTEQQLGANGVLGVGLFSTDGQSYYACTSSACSAVAPSTQVQNPVSALPVDSNGVIVTLPAVASVQNTVYGILTLGLDTQTNNALSGFTTIPADTGGNITVTMNGGSYPLSFIDSGSNAYFLDLPGVPVDGSGFFAPSSPLSYALTLSNASGSATFGAGLTVAATTLSSSLGPAAFPDLGSPSASNRSQDLGLPFFFGRSIAFAIQGASTSAGNGPFYAMH